MLHINGGSSSVVERQIVDLVVEGSNPFFHPLLSSERRCARSSTDRASDFESAGCRFESCRAHETIGPLAQLVEQQTLNLRVKGSIPLRLIHPTARVVELADTLDLGSSIFDVRVQVPPLACRTFLAKDAFNAKVAQG